MYNLPLCAVVPTPCLTYCGSVDGWHCEPAMENTCALRKMASFLQSVTLWVSSYLILPTNKIKKSNSNQMLFEKRMPPCFFLQVRMSSWFWSSSIGPFWSWGERMVMYATTRTLIHWTPIVQCMTYLHCSSMMEHTRLKVSFTPAAFSIIFILYFL